MTTIGEYAFFRCVNIPALVISDGVTRISDTSLIGCSSLETVTIGKSLVDIPEHIFDDIKSLNVIAVVPGNS